MSRSDDDLVPRGGGAFLAEVAARRCLCRCRRQGLRCVMIELRETEIDALIRKGLLKPETRNIPTALSEALYAFLDGTLGATP
jgi:hypothetical protein